MRNGGTDDLTGDRPDKGPITSESIPSFSRDPYADWRPGGRAHLFRVCMRELARDGSFASDAGREALAQLLDLYHHKPLPAEIRQVVQAALRCPRKIKSGPKPEPSQVARLEEALFPLVYEDGLRRGERLRVWLRVREKKRPRNAKPYHIPTARAFACRRIRKWLASFRAMSDAAISNKLSKLRQGKSDQNGLENPFVSISGPSAD